MQAHLVRDWLAGANVFFAGHGNLYGGHSPIAGAVEGVMLVVVDDDKLAVFRLKSVGLRRLSFIQSQSVLPRLSVVVRHERRPVRAFSVWRVGSIVRSHRRQTVGSLWRPRSGGRGDGCTIKLSSVPQWIPNSSQDDLGFIRGTRLTVLPDRNRGKRMSGTDVDPRDSG